MKPVLAWFSLLAVCGASITHAVETLRWERIPLVVSLVVGEERVILLDRNVRVGVPPSVADRLRVQSAGGAIYLRASAPIETTRIDLQDTQSGALILIDVSAATLTHSAASVEPIRIIDTTHPPKDSSRDHPTAAADGEDTAVRQDSQIPTPTPAAVILTRYAAQSLYSPLRTIESVPGIIPMPLHSSLALETLLPGLPIHATALLAWRLDDTWVTAVRLTHSTGGSLDLDPRALAGDFVAATFQHQTLGPAGDCTDTTVVYVVTRAHGLAESLLPALSAVDATLNRHPMDQNTRDLRGTQP